MNPVGAWEIHYIKGSKLADSFPGEGSFKSVLFETMYCDGELLSETIIRRLPTCYFAGLFFYAIVLCTSCLAPTLHSMFDIRVHLCGFSHLRRQRAHDVIRAGGYLNNFHYHQE